MNRLLKYKKELSHQKDALNREKYMFFLKLFITAFILRLVKCDTTLTLFLHNSTLNEPLEGHI